MGAGTGCGLLLGLDDFENAPAAHGGSASGGSASSGGVSGGDASGGGASGTGSASGGGSASSGAGRCADAERDCVGDTPRQCADGEWVQQRPCSGDAPVCLRGRCVPCAEGDRGCAGNKPLRCEQGAWVEEAACAAPFPGCRRGQCVPTSCEGDGGPEAGLSCGADGKQDCCASELVPGGTFYRSNDDKYPATVSTFRLDRYEVTVGRFRRFVEASRGTRAHPPPLGAGERPGITGSGWQYDWSGKLPVNTEALKTQLSCSYYPTWTDTPGPNEARPITCVTWYEAFAFCVWDGGHLPTEAEWNYAAAGGAEQRMYPWGPVEERGLAATECRGDGTSSGCNISAFLPVGSFSPRGDARWGHADMLGNASEWTLDCYDEYPVPCNDCSNQSCSELDPVVRGGNAIAPLYNTAFRNSDERTGWSQGVRCARSAGSM